MKSILTLVMIIGLFVNIYGQQSPERIQWQLQAEKVERLKSGGVALVVVGGILAISGVVTMVDNVSLFEKNSNFRTGGVLFVCGAASLGAGIPLTIVGVHNHRKYKKQLEAISVGVKFAPQQRGLSLAYRF